MDPIIEYRIEVTQDDIEIRGNALVSGDNQLDKEVEDSIIEQLEQGNVWAWCSVRVVATIQGLTQEIKGDAWLGACSYQGQEDFEQCEYYEDMKDEATQDLIREVRRFASIGDECRALDRAFTEKYGQGLKVGEGYRQTR